MNKIIVNMWGGYSSVQKGGSALGLSPRLPKGGQRQGKGVTPYGK